MLLFLKRLYFCLVLALCSILAIGVSPFYFFVSYLRRDRLSHSFQRGIFFYARLCINLFFPIIPYSITNHDFLAKHCPCILVANHQSFLDLYYMAAQNENKLCVIVGSWPFKKLFFFAPFMHMAGYIETERQSSEEIIASCGEALESGSCVICFPEGTRSRTGELQPFSNGIFRIALRHNVPVLPLVFKNTGNVCPPGSLRITPEPIQIKLLDPIYPDTVKFYDKPYLSLKKITHSLMCEALKIRKQD